MKVIMDSVSVLFQIENAVSIQVLVIPVSCIAAVFYSIEAGGLALMTTASNQTNPTVGLFIYTFTTSYAMHHFLFYIP